MVWLAAARSSVPPSGVLLATDALPMVPPAPGRFSTITVRPRAAPSSALNERATMSCTPPAANGTTTRITPEEGCAAAAVMVIASRNPQTPRIAFIAAFLSPDATVHYGQRRKPHSGRRFVNIALAPLDLPDLAFENTFVRELPG